MKYPRFLIALLSVAMIYPAALVVAEVWQATGFEDSPAGSDQASTMDDKVRSVEALIRGGKT